MRAVWNASSLSCITRTCSVQPVVKGWREREEKGEKGEKGEAAGNCVVCSCAPYMVGRRLPDTTQTSHSWGRRPRSYLSHTNAHTTSTCVHLNTCTCHNTQMYTHAETHIRMCARTPTSLNPLNSMADLASHCAASGFSILYTSHLTSQKLTPSQVISSQK